jgi:hypothetical protein
VNINTSKKLHKDGEEQEHEVGIHSATGCCSTIMTCRPIAGERVDKHASIEMDPWKPTRYGRRFRGYG